MNRNISRTIRYSSYISLPLLLGLGALAALFGLISLSTSITFADPIEPPDGYPKLSTSVKTVTPTLAAADGETLFYTIEIRNTGAYTAEEVTFTDIIPDATAYNHDAIASSGPPPTYAAGLLSWTGDVEFDGTVVITFSATVTPAFAGTIVNSAVISQALIAESVVVAAETTVTDKPIFSIDKTSGPESPGANKPLTYTLSVANWGQPAVNLPITVTDDVPANTTLRTIGAGGWQGPGNSVIWTNTLSLSLAETSQFTYSVDIGDVLSGTVITNDSYHVESNLTGITSGEPYTVTVINPILSLSKVTWPDPPGSNREMTYNLTLLNGGSMATGLVLTDVVPTGVTYVRGGTEQDGIVSWNWPNLATGEFAEFTYTVYIADVANVAIVNDDYAACSFEGICSAGRALTSVVQPATFAASAFLDPIAKKPGGGGGPVTPTLVIENLGPGNARDATAILTFGRISVSSSDLVVIPPVGEITPDTSCDSHCDRFIWIGDLDSGDMITFTTIEGQSTIGGEEGTPYTATVSITDSVGLTTTMPVTASAVGHITHYANLLPEKSAPSVIGRGQLLTYTIQVWNSGLSTDDPPFPRLTDTVPMSTTLVNISHGGISQTITGSTSVSWTLPHMSPGDRLARSFTVRVDDDLISGTQIVNSDYRASWYEPELGTVLSNSGPSFTTTVKEVGLIASYKIVTPSLAFPGLDNVLTFSLHLINSGPFSLTGVSVYDWLPWENSTYQRDAFATSGQVISDIVSVEWMGGVAPFSQEVVTLTVLVDPHYQGAITNTAVISHPDLLSEITVDAVAYITNDPVLKITKSASPDPVPAYSDLKYTIHVFNLGQVASGLVITDTIPDGSTYVADSATGGGELVGEELFWYVPLLLPGENQVVAFTVNIGGGSVVVNDKYGVRSAEGISAQGVPVVTQIFGGYRIVYLPAIEKP
ncbi:MAG TPA: hypothetical protein VFI27_02110 [candidate division Zixibacteria bacterium]|nr:hypothetical protein [candidate division Zixibacteria bacterium]